MSCFFDDSDDFWDVSRLVPRKKPAAKPFVTKKQIADVVIDSKTDTDSADEDRKIDFSSCVGNASGDDRKIRSYTPSWSKLISKVTIRPSIDRFDFHGTFRKAALLYFDYKSQKCDFVPFYSYMPQYVQMSVEQKKYYFYWRDEVRHQRYIKTDYSYIYLYVYEIFNLPERIDSETGLKLLCSIWRAYRKEFSVIDSKFSAWVQDYCLIYDLHCPTSEIKDFLFDVITVSQFKEFYLSDISRDGNYSAAMIAYLSDYDWRRGKYAGGTNADIYRKHVEGAMSGIFSKLLEDDLRLGAEVSKLTRSAFQGCLCTHSVKCNLDIEYFSIGSSEKMRSDITAALKYVENKLRACLGVKSRLAVKELPDSFKQVIDEYFKLEFKRKMSDEAKSRAPEYERLYDAVDTEISFERALKLEQSSWKTTALLTEGADDYFEDSVGVSISMNHAEKCEIEDDVLSEASAPKADESDDGDRYYGLSRPHIDFLSAALVCDKDGMKRIAEDLRSSVDAIAECINEAFADNFGDVVLEATDDFSFKIIDDYYEEIEEWIR